MKQQAKAKALSLAYEFVTTSTRYSKNVLTTKLNMNERTLRRIRESRPVKECTHDAAFCALIKILNELYRKDIEQTGGSNSTKFLLMFRKILLTEWEQI